MRKMGKRILGGLLCLLLLTALLPMPTVKAASAKVLCSGKCGANVTWQLTDDGVLTISGSGPMRYCHTPPVEGYNGPDAPWYVWGGEYVAIKEVVIENGVTSIGGYAFYDCHNLTKVTIPESVTLIDEFSFLYCHNLSHVTIPASVKEIGERAFGSCTGLTSVTFLGNAPSIDSRCFEGVTATVYSPCVKGWGSEKMTNYSGTLTWAGHVYSDHSITQAATCTENARAVGTCPDCGTTADLTVPESATGHSYDQNGICTACSEQISLTVDVFGRIGYYGGGLDYASVTVYADGKSIGSVSVDIFIGSDYVRKTFPYSPHKTYTFVWNSYPIYDEVFFAYSLGDRVLTYGYPEYQSIGKVSYTLASTQEHQYNTVTTPATCTTEGFVTDVCTVCGSRTQIATIPATGHNYTSDITTVPTCTGEGVRTFRCSWCGDSYTERIGAKGHRYDADGRCVDCAVEFSMVIYMTDTYGDGWNGATIEVYTGDALLTEVSLAPGAVNGEAEIPFVPAQTYRLQWHSGSGDNECGFKVMLNGNTLIAGTGISCFDGRVLCTYETTCAHVDPQNTVTPPTCTEEGYTSGLCAVCGYSGVIDTIPATGHSYVDGVCTICQHIEVLDSGSCGKDLQWKLDVLGTLTISGTGAMKDYTAPDEVTPNTPWYQNRLSITRVVVESGVTTIGAYAFHGCTALTEVTLPGTVTTIGKLAFYNCTGLRSVTLPEGLTTIGSAAFRRCGNLTSVILPESLTTIGKIAFYDCTALTQVTVPGKVAEIGEYAFGNCTALTGITFSGSAPTIGQNSFIGVSAAVSYGCSDEMWMDITKQSYGGTLTWQVQHNYVNGVCTGCQDMVLPAGGSCGKELLWQMDTSGTLTITGTGPMTDYTVDQQAPWYKKLDAVRAVKIGDGVTTIGSRAFQGCTNLTDVTIPQSVTTIGIAAFYLCGDLTEVTLPRSVTHIGGYAFKDCTGLTTIVFSGQAPVMESTCFRNVTATAEYPCGDETWTEDVRQSYGGTITWEAGHREQNGICPNCGAGRLTGDLDGDGQRTIVDVSRLYAHTMQTLPLDSETLACADVNGDGAVDIGDTARLYAHVRGTKPLN